jgi:hypothetical protein
VDEELTARQRRVFVAIVLNDVPPDTLVIGLASRRGGICKALPRPGVSCGPFLPLTGVEATTDDC